MTLTQCIMNTNASTEEEESSKITTFIHLSDFNSTSLLKEHSQGLAIDIVSQISDEEISFLRWLWEIATSFVRISFLFRERRFRLALLKRSITTTDSKPLETEVGREIEMRESTKNHHPFAKLHVARKDDTKNFLIKGRPYSYWLFFI